MIAGLIPAWLAARAEPVASVRPPVLGVRRARQPGGITALAAVNATVALGVLAVADVVFLNIRERAPELATIRTFGWPESALSRLVITEGAIIGLAGSLAGAALGLAAAAQFAGQLPATLYAAGVTPAPLRLGWGMSNLDRSPTELMCERHEDGSAGPVVLPYRNVPLGGPRAMTVRRSLPQRAQSLIGAWCFVDHYGPDDVSLTGGMAVPGHPHTELQTASWLFTGEVEHRDTTGTQALIRPGQLNLMTAGSGIAHSEYSTPTTNVLHGAQLWIALPEADRFAAPGFAHYEPPVTDVDGAKVLVFLGSLFGQTSPVPMYSALVGAEVTLAAGHSLDVKLDAGHEHGFLCDTGSLAVGGAVARPGEILFQPAGASAITLEASPSEPTRVLVLGGKPFGEQIVMWWNFIGRSHEEVVAFREEWQRQRAGRTPGAPGRYGAFPDVWEHTLSAPELPNVRLRSRG